MAGCLDHGPEEVERDGAGAALGEHAAEAAFAGADVEDELAVYVSALFQHDVVEEHGAAWVAFVDEADVLGREGFPAAVVDFLGHQNPAGEKGRPLCPSGGSWRSSAQSEQSMSPLADVCSDFTASEMWLD